MKNNKAKLISKRVYGLHKRYLIYRELLIQPVFYTIMETQQWMAAIIV